MLKISIGRIGCGRLNKIPRNRFYYSQLNVKEEASMTTDHRRNEDNTCKEKCDDDFIRCVEQSQANCLDNFNQCASVCNQ